MVISITMAEMQQKDLVSETFDAHEFHLLPTNRCNCNILPVPPHSLFSASDDAVTKEAEAASTTAKTSFIKSVDKTMSKVVVKTADITKIPKWGVVAIFIGIILVVCGVLFFCVRRFFRKRRGKDGKKGMKGVDLKSVQLLGSAYKEKVT